MFNLFLLQSLIAIEQKLRWKYLIKFYFPLSHNSLDLLEKQQIFLKFLSELFEGKSINYFWVVKEIEYNYVFFLFLSTEFDYNFLLVYKNWKSKFKKKMQNNLINIEYVFEWTGWLYFYHWDSRHYKRIYKKLYNISEIKFDYFKFMLHNNVNNFYNSFSLDFETVVKNTFIYLKYCVQYLLYINFFLFFFKKNIWYFFDSDYFSRYFGNTKDKILSNGLSESSDPLVIYDWVWSLKFFLKLNYRKSSELIFHILKKNKVVIIQNFFYFVDKKKIDELFDIVFLFILLVYSKKLILSLDKFFFKVASILFSEINKNNKFLIFFWNKKNNIKLGKIFINCFKLILNDYFLFSLKKIGKKKYIFLGDKVIER